MSVSAWLLAEIKLARARIALKVDPAQAAIEAKLRRALEAAILPTLTGIIDGLDSYPTTPGAVTAPLAGLIEDMAPTVEQILAQASVQEIRELIGDPKFNIGDYSPQVAELLKTKAFTLCQRTLDNLIGDLNASLTASFEAGLGIDDAANALKDVFDDLKNFELERIARTEINSTQNQVAAQTIRDLNIDYHQWIATQDDRTRESHLEMDGLIVRVGDLFPNGLEYPGDPNGAPEEVINCRCRIRPYIFPAGTIAPIGMDAFTEADLVTID